MNTGTKKESVIDRKNMTDNRFFCKTLSYFVRAYVFIYKRKTEGVKIERKNDYDSTDYWNLDDGHCQCWEHGGSRHVPGRNRGGNHEDSEGGDRHCAGISGLVWDRQKLSKNLVQEYQANTLPGAYFAEIANTLVIHVYLIPEE